jgi:guanylate kinase
MDKQSLEELRSDRIQEAKRDAQHEFEMRDDFDYCLEHTDIAEAMALLESICKVMGSYGWSVTPLSLVEDA